LDTKIQKKNLKKERKRVGMFTNVVDKNGITPRTNIENNIKTTPPNLLGTDLSIA
jgi:hypothetical protein